MFEGLGSFLTVDSTFLLGGGIVSAKGREDEVVVIVMFDVEVEG